MVGFEKTIGFPFWGLSWGINFRRKNSSALHLKTGEVVDWVGPNLHQGKHSQCPSQKGCSHFGSRPGAKPHRKKNKFFYGRGNPQKITTLAWLERKFMIFSRRYIFKLVV